ncbi:mucin-19 [Schistocerca serialis cubense]|uniref:mucin-19 n=1 Tax=Schistocerca serialis cubense TaxID=2023355 RepID=UPI00214F10F6|nr:mucin-19 [Schistocerca serialis cubense]
MQPFKNRAETFIALFILIALGVLSAYLAVFLAFLGVCAYLYLEYEANNLGFHVEVLKSAILSTSIWLQSTMSSFVRNLQQRSGLVSDEPKSEIRSISRADSPVTSRLRRVSIATNGSRYSRNSDLNISRSVSSPTRYRLSPANRSVLDVCNRSDSRSPQKQSYNEAMGYAYKSSPWNRNAHSPLSEKARSPKNASVRTVQNVGGPLLASPRSNTNKTFDLRLYADVNSPGLAERSVYYSRMGGASPGMSPDENRRPLSPPAVTHQPQYRTVGQFPLVRLGQKGAATASLPLLTAAVSPKAPRAHSVSMNVKPVLVEGPAPAPLTPAAGKALSARVAGVSSPGLSGVDRSDPHDISAKSVIEALKEISRKRIRSQCLTPNEVPDDESAKRQRRNVSSDSGRADNSEVAESSAGLLSPSTYQTKRGRSDSFNGSGESGSTPRGTASDETPGTRSRVKRLCSNEILSSLSSSRCLLVLAANNKRKFTISPDGSPRSGTPVPVQTGKHFKSGSSPDTEEQNGREEDMVQAEETSVRRRSAETAVEDAPASPPPARAPTPARDTGVSAADGEDVTPEHWKRPKDADRDAALPHRATPHPARKLVGTRDLAEQRRADRSALVGLLTVIGKGESPFRDGDRLQPAASPPTSRRQKHVSFADTQKPGELARADTAPVTESQQAPCVGTPTTASSPDSPGQGGMTGTGTTNTPPTVSRNTQKAQAFMLKSSPTGSVMSSSAAPSGRSPSPFTVSAGQLPASSAGSDSSSSNPTGAAASISPFTARPVTASTPVAPSGATVTTASGALSQSAPETRPTTATHEAVGMPTGARATPRDAASQPQVHMSTATSTAFSFGSPKMSTVATVSATPVTAAGVPAPQSAGEFRFGAGSVTSTTTTSSAGGFSFTLPASTAASTTSPAKGAFQFGQNATSTVATAKLGGFQFAPGAADKVGRQAATSGPGATASQPSIFSSSAAYSKATTTETAASPFAAAAVSQSHTSLTSPAPTPSFGSAPQKGIFGATPTTTVATAQQSIFGGAAAPVFGAGNATSSQAPTFGSTAATTQSSVFGTSVFGSTTQNQSQTPSGTSNVSQVSTFGSGTTAATPTFGSGTMAATPTFGSGSTSAAPAFGSTGTAATPAFGSTTTAATPAFGSGTTAPALTFGSGTTTQAPAFGGGTTSQTPAFGSAATSQTPAFGSGTSTQAPVFGAGTSQGSAFGSGATSQAPTFGSGTTTQAPAFGAGTSSQTPAFGAGTSSQTPTFGSATTTQTPTFGAIPTSQAPAFGSATTNQLPAFGSSSQNRPAVFGSVTTSQAPAFGTGQTPAIGAGSSGQIAAPGSGSQLAAFGASGTGQTPAFGSSSGQTPTFGSNTGQVPTFGSGSSGSTPAFGSANRATVFGSGATPSFGGASSAAATTQSSVFGTATPTFGTSGANRPPFGTASPFGSSLGTTPGFGSTSTSQTPAFGSPFVGSGDAKPAFGSTAQASAAVTTAGQQGVFAFGAASPVTTTAAAGAVPFQFGATGQSSSAAAPKPGGFQFGQSTDASPAAFPFAAPAGQASTPKGAFQFNAAGQTPGGSVPNVFGQSTPGSVGMFSIGSGSTAPRSRTSRMRNKNR